jgi:hypothetical protein
MPVNEISGELTATARVDLLDFGKRCGVACPACNCSDRPLSPQRLSASLAATSGQLIVRGAGIAASLRSNLERVAAHRSTNLTLVSSGVDLHTAGAVQAMLAARVTALRVPLTSHSPDLHDRLVQESNAFSRAERSLRSAVDAGIHASVEIPLLSPRFQNPAALIERLLADGIRLSSARFYVVRHALDRRLAPPPLAALSQALSAALTVCQSAGVAVEITREDGIPLCTFSAQRQWLAVFENVANDVADPQHRDVEPGRVASSTVASAASFAPACSTCSVVDRCAGMGQSYVAAHGTDALFSSHRFSYRAVAHEPRRRTPHRSPTASPSDRSFTATRTAFSVAPTQRPATSWSSRCEFTG